MRAVEVRRFGGPEVLELVDLAEPRPGPGELLVAVSHAGVNWRDLLHRGGSFGAELPFVPGAEGAGRVLAAGDGADRFAVGSRVAWKLGASYAERVVVSQAETVQVPDGIGEDVAAGVLLQGLTAHFLATSSVPLGPGTVALVHAAAGGVGSLLTQVAKLLGARVIATVSSPGKAQVATELGADEVVIYGEHASDFADEVRALTSGKGVDVVYDGVGASTFDASLASLATRGTLVLYGSSSGAVAPFEVMRLMHGGSLTLMRPSVRDFTAERAELDRRAGELFSWIASGAIVPRITVLGGLGSAPTAQRELETRQSTGKLVLAL